MSNVLRLVGLFLAIAVIVSTMFVAINGIFGNKVSFNSPNISAEEQIDKDVEELNKLFTEYQLDVYVTSSHMATHSTSTDAIRCMNNKGNIQAFSEFNSRRIHMLCWDGETLYDIIINRINYWVEKFKNPKSELVTAYAPEGVQGADQASKVNFYLEHLKNTIGGKVVNLHFGPGEVMFIPK